MAGMAPAQKAKKGRFGAGGTNPTLSVSGPDSVTEAVASTDFTAVANDDVDTPTVAWVSDLDGSVGTGLTPSITLTTVGTHVITVTASAATGSQTVSKTLTVECVAA